MYTVLIANDFPPVTSGIATLLYNTWRLLPSRCTKVIAPRLPGATKVDARFPAPVHRIYLPLGEGSGAKVTKTLLTLFWVLRISHNERPRSFHCGQVFSSGLAGWLAYRWYRIPYVVWVYGSETARLAQSSISITLMRHILLESQCVVTDSNATSEEFLKFGVPEGKLKRIYPGVDPETFSPKPKDPGWVKRLGLDGRRVLLTVARLDQRKGHDMVMRALAILEGAEDVVYLIAGAGREKDRLNSLVSELNLEGKVQFLGYVPDEDLPTVYNLCDVYVMPNRVTEGTQLGGDLEGFGISFLEAGACEKPVIGGRSGGAVEAILEGRTGLLVDPYSEAEIAQAVQKLLSDSVYSSQLGIEARRRIEREFDWRILSRQVEELL